ncbi:MAG: ABC transporter permease [Actinomycetia bacterium]|nr:ABC transporter permease [Actinomycetes bacterium]
MLARLRSQRDLVVVYSALGLLVIVAAIIQPLFRTQFNVEVLFGASLALGLAAIGQTFVVLTGGIDLSVGSTMSLITVVAAVHMDGSNGRLATAILIAVAIGAAIGLFNGLVVAGLRAEPIVATLGTLSVVQGLTLWQSVQPTGRSSPALESVIYKTVDVVPRSAIVLAAAFAIGTFVLRRTRYGLHIYALGGAEESARLSGVPTFRVKASAYMLCGIFSALAGLALAGRLGQGDPIAGQFFLLTSVAAVAIGGTSLFGGRGGLIGTLGGVLILTVLTNVLTLEGVGTYPKNVTTGLLIITVVIIYRVVLRVRGPRRPRGSPRSSSTTPG